MPPELTDPTTTHQKKSGKSTLPSQHPEIPRALTAKGNPSSKADPEYLRTHQINLNTATAEELQLLPGIGPSMAQKILDYRAQNGPFETVDDLTKIRGIGQVTLEKLRALVTTGQKNSPRSTPTPIANATEAAPH